MKYKLFKNSKTGMHCVQACLRMALHYFGREVLSFRALDRITGHDPDKFTWMGKAVLWLEKQGFKVTLVENLDYGRFAMFGEKYLKTIWDKETFAVQKRYSDLKQEQKTASHLVKSNINLQNRRLNLGEIKRLHTEGYFTILSVNPCTLNQQLDYGSHLIVVKKFAGATVEILDPDHPRVRKVPTDLLIKSISKRHKPDFNAIFIKEYKTENRRFKNPANR